MTSLLAAQYIRMSTDKQDLSPTLQKDAIAAYAEARGMQIVATYEDEGRSGVRLKNRPALLRLLHDVTQSQPFSTVLVYDVSRWGRFQDTDAAAYHEYHCRLHGVDVVYVAEMFGAEVNPITAMLKSMKRAMAAEYSRDLANKARAGQHLVISRGFQIGPLPPLGYRRCSVSADGQRRVILDARQRKVAATDRVEWVLAADEEIRLVRRICELYTRTRLTFNDIARLGKAEGWRDHEGRTLTGRSLATLVRNEALIGNFVWGRRKHAKSLINCPPSRRDGCIPRLIDDDTWAQIQRRTELEINRKQTAEQIVVNLSRALQRSPLLTTRDLRAQGLPSKRTIRTRLGEWAGCLEQAGQDAAELSQALVERSKVRRASGRKLGLALAQTLREDDQLVRFDGRSNVLRLTGLNIRLRPLWSMVGEVGLVWRIRVEQINRNVDFDLLVRMEDTSRPKDFFVVSPADVAVRFPQWLVEQVPLELTRFWCQDSQELVERIRVLNDRGMGSKADSNHLPTESLAG